MTHPPKTIPVTGRGIQIDATEISFSADRLDVRPDRYGVSLVATRADGRESITITLDSLSELTESLVEHDSEHVADVLRRHEDGIEARRVPDGQVASVTGREYSTLPGGAA